MYNTLGGKRMCMCEVQKNEERRLAKRVVESEVKSEAEKGIFWGALHTFPWIRN